MDPLNLFSSSQECIRPSRVVWTLEKPLADILRQGRKNLYEMLNKAKDYIRYEERMPDFSLGDVMNRIDIVLATAETEIMTEEEAFQAEQAQEIMNRWTTSLLKILEIAIRWMKFNGRVRKSSLRLMEGKPYIEGEWEGKTIIQAYIPADHFVPVVVFVSREVVKIEFQVTTFWERVEDRMDRAFNIEMIPTLKENKTFGLKSREHASLKTRCVNTSIQEDKLMAGNLNILMWNARGVGNEECKENLREIRRFFSPKIVIVVETWKSKDQSMQVVKDLGFSGFYIVGARTFSGGIWFLWDEDLLTINGAVESSQAIHAVATMKNRDEPWMLSAVYADPHKEKKKELWKEFDSLSSITDVAWMAAGDFNTIKDVAEKQGGRNPTMTQLQELRDVMYQCNFQELEGEGASFTWTNKRHGDDNI